MNKIELFLLAVCNVYKINSLLLHTNNMQSFEVLNDMPIVRYVSIDDILIYYDYINKISSFEVWEDIEITNFLNHFDVDNNPNYNFDMDGMIVYLFDYFDSFIFQE